MSVLITVLVSTACAFLAGIGVGGGSILLLWLTLVLNYSPVEARFINLLFFLPCAMISSIYRWKEGTLSFRRVMPGTIAGCLAAGIFSYFSSYLDTTVLNKFFGILLLITGLREILYKKKEHP